MKMKIGVQNFALLFAMAFVFASFSFVSAETSCAPAVSLINQDPNPANPDGYMKVLFEINDLYGCDGYSVRLNPEYPFSVDSNTSLVNTISSNPYAKESSSTWMVTYKLKVDKDALDGDYSLKLQMKEGSDGLFDGFYNSYQEQGFIVSIQDSRTAFDAVIQDYSSSEVSIAIANVGKYTANSVVVRIPEQSDYTVTGTDGQMVGNIDSGDYTLVGFEISSKSSALSNFQGGRLGSRNVTDQGIPMAQTSNTTSKLQFDIYYTDNLGERRVVNMELPLKTSSNSTSIARFGGRQSTTTSTARYLSWKIWIIIIFIVSLVFYFRKNPDKLNIIISKFKKHKKTDSGVAPDWIKKAKEKEKK